MTHSRLLGTMTKAMFRLSGVLVVAISLATNCAYGRVLGAGDGKASLQLLEKMAAGTSQDLIVVFDDQVIQERVQAMQSDMGLPSHHSRMIEHKAALYTEKKQEVLSAFESHEVTVLKHYSHLPVSFVRIHSKAALDRLLAYPSVIAVYEDRVVHRAMLAQSLPLIGQPQAVAAGNQGSGTTVAVLDQRVDYTLPAFGSCTSPGIPSNCKVVLAQDITGLPNDGLGYQDGHGTNVAATVLAVAPGSQIISLNVFNGESSYDSKVIDAINWCIANASAYKIVAINLSLASSSSTALTTTSPYYFAFANARSAGILPVVAAGNNNYVNGLSIPAAVVGAVSVGAVYDTSYGSKSWAAPCVDTTTSADQVACFSNSASFLTMLAPGCQNDGGNLLGYMCGTSQATPHVAGAVAVLRSAYPSESLNQTVARLTNGVPVTDSKNGVTKPRLSLPMALALPPCSYIVSPTSLSPSAGGTTTSNISVTNGAGCAWSAISNVNWITILSGSSGTGSGTAQYSIGPNYGSSARTGTISIAGQTITATQPGGYVSLSSLTNVWLAGSYSYQVSGLNTVVMNVDQILHNSTGTTGTLRLELWLTQLPYSLGMSGWPVATYQISIPDSPSGTLGPYQYFSNITATRPLVNFPAPGSYYATLLVTEYGSTSCGAIDHFCMDTFGGFTGKFFISDVTPPTVPTGFAATAKNQTQVNLAWNASSDDVAVTAYKVYNNGVLLGRVTTVGALAFNLSPVTSYQFTVSACDAAENCSAQSAAALATTLTPPNYTDSWYNANESGWGITITDHDTNAFVQWYTYDQTGHNQKYVISGGTFSNGKCLFSGDIKRITGPSWTLPTFDSTQVTRTTVGAGTIDFCPTGLTNGTIVFDYTAEGVTGSKQLSRLSFGNDVPHWGGTANTGSSDFSDLWWNSSESGWGVSVTQHGNNLFFRVFAYDTDNRPLLFIVPGVTFNSSTSFTGNLVLTSGPWYGTEPFDPNQVVRTTAGTATLTFSDADNGVLSYTVNGVTVTKTITRVVF